MKFRFKGNRNNRTVTFDSILPSVIDDLDLEKSFTIEYMKENWRSVVGDIISTHSIPERVQKQTLIIAVDHNIYANEIIMMKDTILKRIKNEFRGSGVSALRVEVKKLTWNKKRKDS